VVVPYNVRKGGIVRTFSGMRGVAVCVLADTASSARFCAETVGEEATAAVIAIVTRQWACAGAIGGGLAARGTAVSLSRVADDAVSLVAAGTSARPTHQNTYPTFASLPIHSTTTTTLQIAAIHTQYEQAHTRKHAVA
jgi:hypothetical protein